MLTKDQESLIEATAPVVAEHIDEITKRFYPLMFQRYPDVKPLFNEANQKSGQQPRALAAAVVAYVQMRKHPELVGDKMAVVVSKHVSLGIRADQYPIVGECLMAAIGDVLGEAITPEIADAWGALYWELADFLIEQEDAHYAAFAGKPGGWRGTRRFRIAATNQESAVIRSFVLEPEDGGTVADFQPGQFIGVRLTIDGEPVYRHYSLSEEPNGRYYRISVKRDPNGTASRHLHDAMTVGDTLELLPPAGDLTLQKGSEPLLLVSGGVGQTPMLPLARQALADGRKVVYIHAAIDADHHAFAEEIASLREGHPEQLQTVTIYDQGGGGDHAGRIDRDLLARYLPGSETRCYFVGPAPFMSAVENALADLGVPEDRRHYEYFGPSQPLQAA
ncbi:NO-inducible flavohemoprotein [Guyparkeria sp. TX1]|uniref:NO-inducible flavohemoprotein n=1 Tax=Guyparkeria sp. TX1 TaxID=3115001 RepID=UPI00397743B0